MSNVYFCATDFYLNGGYVSYSDFYALAKLSGYPVIPLSEIDPQSNNTYIVTPLNDEWMQGWQNPRARIIHWELEWRQDWRADVNTPPGIAETWVSDPTYAKAIGARFVQMGSHSGLGIAKDRVKTPPLFDVALMAYRDPRRRAELIYELERRNLKIAPNGWGLEREFSMVHSRCMVHIHQWDDKRAHGIAPLRWALCAAYELPLITETVPDRAPFGYGDFLQADYQYLADFVTMWCKDPYLQGFGHGLHQRLCVENTFAMTVQRALQGAIA